MNFGKWFLPAIFSMVAVVIISFYLISASDQKEHVLVLPSTASLSEVQIKNGNSSEESDFSSNENGAETPFSGNVEESTQNDKSPQIKKLIAELSYKRLEVRHLKNQAEAEENISKSLVVQADNLLKSQSQSD